MTTTVSLAAVLAAACWLRRQIQGYWYDRGFDVSLVEGELRGRVVVVTGGNNGIGLAAAKGFAALGCHVVIGCRSDAKGAAAVAAVSGSSGSASYALLDLLSARSVEGFAAAVARRHPQVHCLVCNAGISGMNCQGGTEQAQQARAVWHANYLGHWQLVESLRGRLAGRLGRVVSVASGAHTGATIEFGGVTRPTGSAYGQSKLAQIMHMKALQRRLDKEGAGALALSVTPGFVRTGIITGSVSGAWRVVFVALWPLYAFLGRTPHGGAQTLLFAALSKKEALGGGGGYFSNCVAKPATGEGGIANDEAKQEKLWELSERMVEEAVEAERAKM